MDNLETSFAGIQGKANGEGDRLTVQAHIRKPNEKQKGKADPKGLIVKSIWLMSGREKRQAFQQFQDDKDAKGTGAYPKWARKKTTSEVWPDNTFMLGPDSSKQRPRRASKTFHLTCIGFLFR